MIIFREMFFLFVKTLNSNRSVAGTAGQIRGESKAQDRREIGTEGEFRRLRVRPRFHMCLSYFLSVLSQNPSADCGALLVGGREKKKRKRRSLQLIWVSFWSRIVKLWGKHGKPLLVAESCLLIWLHMESRIGGFGTKQRKSLKPQKEKVLSGWRTFTQTKTSDVR